MTRTTGIIIGIFITVAVLGLALLAYIWFSGGSAAPSATLSVPTLAIITNQATTSPTKIPLGEATVEPLAAATAEMTTTANSAQSNLRVFNISSDQSKVSFTVGEVLNGSPNSVVGTTNQVAGQFAVDFTNPANSQIGEIRIDARTLATDSELRDRTIRGQILQSSQDQFEFISFKPTAITELPATVTMGQSFAFQVTGDLTIRDVTKPATFDVTVTPDSQTKIRGSATAVIGRSDFNLTIPNVPNVASVDEAVELNIDFVATAAT